MRRNSLLVLMFLFVIMLISSIDAYALTSVIRWQDGSNSLVVNDGDDVYFEVGVVDFDFPLTISLSLLKDGSKIHVFEDKLNHDDLLFEGRYLISKEQYKTPGNFVVFLEAKDSDGESKTSTLFLNVLEPEKDEEGAPIINNLPVVENILITEENGIFNFEITSTDLDGDEIKNYETRVLAQYGEHEYGVNCIQNKCSFDSKDPLSDGGSEKILFDESAVVKARAYDGKNWGNWFEKNFVIDNRDEIVEDEKDHDPVLASIGNKGVFENSELKFTVEATDEDNDIASINADNLPAGAVFTNNIFTWKPGYEVVGHGGLINGIIKFITFGMLGNEPSADFEVTFTVVDSKGNYDLEKIKIKVRDVNRLPSLEAFDVGVNEGELVKVEAFISDPDNDKVKATYSAPLNSNGEWQTGFADAGIYVATITADDSYGGVVRKTININVADVNRAPVIDSIDGVKEVFEGDLVELKVNAHDADLDALLYGVDSSLFSKNVNIFRWQTNIGDKGTYSLNFEVDDGKGGRDSENLILVVKEKINLAPTAEILKPEKDLTINTGDSLEFVGRGEDSDGTIEEYKWLINGVEVSDKDKFTYTFDKESTHKVEFLVKDNGDKWSEPDSVNIKVEKKIIILNNAPVIDNIIGAREVFEGDVIELTVNAHDIDNDELIYSITGNKFSQSGNKFIWRTSDSDIGSHFFIVSVNDGKLSDHETVSVVVKQKPIVPIVNQAPVVLFIPDQEVFVGDVFAYQVVASDEDKDLLTYSLIEKPSGMRINSAGKITWIANRLGSHNIVVAVSDSKITVSERFTLVVREKPVENQAPVVSDIPDQTITSGQAFSDINLDSFVFDPDNADSEISWIISGAERLTVNIDANRIARVLYQNGFTGNEILTFTATDKDGASDSDSARFTVQAIQPPANNPPSLILKANGVVVNNLEEINVKESQTIRFDLSSSTDPDRDVLKYGWRFNRPENILAIPSAIIGIDRPFDFEPRDRTGSYNIKFVIEDGKGGKDEIIVRVNFIKEIPANKVPVVANIPNQELFIGDIFVYQVIASDQDEDALTYSLIQKPSGMRINSAGKITWIANRLGSHNIIVAVSDSKITVSERFTLVVMERPIINQAPVVSDIPDQTITSGQAFSDINLDSFVFDPDNADSEISWIVSGAEKLTVNIDANRIARISYPSGFVGSETIVFTAVDPSGARNSDVATFTVQAPVVPANNNPVLTVKRAGIAVDKVTINEGENLVLNLEATDIDNDRLRFAVMSSPPGSVFSNGVFSWIPSNVQGGRDYVVVFRVFDLTNGRLKGGSDTKTVTITVIDSLEPMAKIEKEKVKRHILNVKSIIINNWETVKKGETFNFDVVVENKGNVRENNVKITLHIPQLDLYERSSSFGIKKNRAETRSFSVIVPEEMNDETIYAVVTVSSDKDEITEVIGFLVE